MRGQLLYAGQLLAYSAAFWGGIYLLANLVSVIFPPPLSWFARYAQESDAYQARVEKCAKQINARARPENWELLSNCKNLSDIERFDAYAVATLPPKPIQ